MEDDSAAPIIGSILMAIVFFVMFITVSGRLNDIKEEAVKHNVAEWVVDTKGNTTWHWKEPAR